MQRSSPLFTQSMLILACFTACAPASAQVSQPKRFDRIRPKSNKEIPTTEVEIELLTDDAGVGQNAQQWAELLRKHDVAVRIRRGTPRDEAGVSESTIGNTVRMVKVVAHLDRRGAIRMPDRQFTTADNDALREWIRGLRTYGAQGSPEGQPGWGLSKEQMDQVLAALKRPIQIDTQGKDILAGLLAFTPNPDQGDLPIHVTPAAKEIMALPQGEQLFPHSLVGVSRGSALSILLSYYGLCFTPQRTPAGKLELAIHDAEKIEYPWPIGWPWPEDTPRNKIAPSLFKFVNVELVDQPLPDVLTAAAKTIEIPIFVDHAQMEKWDIDFNNLKVNYPAKKTSWIVAIRQIAFNCRLKRELYVDEAGKPFIWLTPIEFRGERRESKSSKSRKK